MASSLTAARGVMATSTRSPARARLYAKPAVPVRPVVAVRSTPTEDPSAKLQEQFNEAVAFVKTKWQETEDSEKPAAVAIIVSAIVAQIVIGATVEAVDRLPFINQFLEFVGLAVTGVYGYRYITDPEERESVKENIDAFVSSVTGKKTVL